MDAPEKRVEPDEDRLYSLGDGAWLTRTWDGIGAGTPSHVVTWHTSAPETTCWADSKYDRRTSCIRMSNTELGLCDEHREQIVGD